MGLHELDNLVRIRQLKTESPSQAEMDGLIRSGNARLKDAYIATLSLESIRPSHTTRRTLSLSPP